MRIYLVILLSLFAIQCINIEAQEVETYPWATEFTKKLIEGAANKEFELSNYPIFNYPNEQAESIVSKFPEDKVLIFGYGSLMNLESAARSISPQALESMTPVIAFGVKRLFNYKASKTAHWGDDQHEKEKAMLNLSPTMTKKSIVNGVVIEVGRQEFKELIVREKGYDLAPVVIADWDDVMTQNPKINFRIAYTFYVPNELRYLPDETIGTNFIQMKYYPVRGYLNACRTGAARFGEAFLDLWNNTTYLANGKTLVKEWDEDTFKGKLCNKEP